MISSVRSMSREQDIDICLQQIKSNDTVIEFSTITIELEEAKKFVWVLSIMLTRMFSFLPDRNKKTENSKEKPKNRKRKLENSKRTENSKENKCCV